MNDNESEVERLARDARKTGKIVLIVTLGCTGAIVLGVLVLIALAWRSAAWFLG